MRPLSSTVKTALIFYLGYAGLLLMVTLGLPTKEVMVTKVNRDEQAASFEKSIDLSLKENEFQKAWQEVILKMGFSPELLYKLQEEKLMERNENSIKITWINSRSILVLPAAPSEEPLVQMGSQWKDLTNKHAFILSSAKWGFSQGYLWLKLINTVKLNIVGKQVKLPIAQITLMQPVSASKEQFFGLIPVLPPQLPIATLLKQLPDLTYESPSIKDPRLDKTVKSPLQKRARVGIIIDDVGYVSEPADQLLKIPAPLTWAILPAAPFTKKYTELAKKNGFEILLHLPLEPLTKTENPGPAVIKRSWSDEEIIDQVNKDLAEVPGAIGINNHMGSAGTSDDRLMGILMKAIKSHRLFFIDSLTTAGSVAEKYARLNGVPFAKRKVFIDNENSLNLKCAALRKLIKIALRDGEAIGIAHVREGTAQAIIEMLPEFVKSGVEIVPISELVK